MRITGGTLRSRALRAPRGAATRPTSDRVREALFSTLASAGVLEGARVLDLYAGTGALGLEALSRGAATAAWVENARDALIALQANIEALGLGDRGRVWKTSVVRAAAQAEAAGASYDLVFVDPPYSDVPSGAVAKALAPWLASPTLLDAEVTLVLEHATRDAAPTLAGLHVHASKRYGDTTLSTYRRS